MSVEIQRYKEIVQELMQQHVVLIAVSKTKPAADIQALYDLGQRDFGENYVQELVEKQAQLPTDIRWHFIGHLQSNKVKYIAPFVQLIHGVDNVKLLKEIDKQAAKWGRVIDVLLQVYIAREETKFGMDAATLDAVMQALPQYAHVRVCGLMGMASFSDDPAVVRSEFKELKKMADTYQCAIRSMGMSGDYKIAIEEGSNMVRIGSLLFGSRQYA